MKKVLILGLGAVGASIAAQFSDGNYPITVLCNGARKERYKQNGFIINNKRYDFNYFTASSEYTQQPDLVIIAVKYHDLKGAIKQLDGLIGEETIIISLLNGIDSEEVISERFGYAHIIHAFIYRIDAIKVQNVVNYYSKGIIVFGEKDISSQVSEKISRTKEIFNFVKINYVVSDNIMKRMWWKYMSNIGLNQTTAVLKAPYRVLQEVTHAQELAKAAMQETVLISQAVKINLSEEDITTVMEMLKKLDPDGKSSMLQDVELKRKTEVDMFSGKLCKLGEQYHIPTPINKVFYYLIKSMESLY